MFREAIGAAILAVVVASPGPVAAQSLGANVLVGGSNRTIALQPVSVSGQVGINIALGVADLSLWPVR